MTHYERFKKAVCEKCKDRTWACNLCNSYIEYLENELDNIIEDRDLWKLSESTCNQMYKELSDENDKKDRLIESLKGLVLAYAKEKLNKPPIFDVRDIRLYKRIKDKCIAKLEEITKLDDILFESLSKEK
jgi:hypothetical protein